MNRVGVISAAAKMAGVGRRTHYHWLSTDGEYRNAFESIRQLVCMQIEDSLVDRLIHGWVEPVYYKARKVGEYRRYDNSAALAYEINLVELIRNEKRCQRRS